MPPPALALGDNIIGIVKGELFGQETQTTFHWKVSETDNGSTPVDVAESMIDELLPDFLLIISEEWTSKSCYCRRVWPAPTRGFEVPTAGQTGAITAGSLPPSVAGVCSRFTNLPGPGGRGRIFVPGVPLSWHENGQLSNAGYSAYVGFLPWLDLAWDPGEGTVYEPILYKGAGVSFNIESASARKILRSQRRREIGVGV